MDPELNVDDMSDEELSALVAQLSGAAEAPAAPPQAGEEQPEGGEAEGGEGDAAEDANEAPEGEDTAEPPAPAPAPAAQPPQAPQALPPEVLAALDRDRQAAADAYRANLASLHGEEVADAIIEAEERGRTEVAQQARQERFALSLEFARASLPSFDERMREVGGVMDRAAFGALVDVSKAQPNPALWLWEQTKAIVTPSDRAAMVEAAKKEAAREAAKKVAAIAKGVSAAAPKPPSIGTMGGGGVQGIGLESLTSYAQADELPDDVLDLLAKQARGR